MMANREIMWAGVRFNPDHVLPRDRELVDNQHALITQYISRLEERGSESHIQVFENGASVAYIQLPIEEMVNGELVNVCRAPDGCRIGFGLLVQDAHEGDQSLKRIERWLRDLGLGRCLIAVFVYSPASQKNPPTSLV